MNTMNCPGCGSLSTMGQPCPVCGQVVKESASGVDREKPVSFVSPPASGQKPSSWQAPSCEASLAYQRMREQSKRKTRLVTWLVVLALGLTAYGVYSFFLHRAVAYGGYYWNSSLYFAMTFPAKGWSHYRQSELKSLPLADSLDAFYMGSGRNPELLMTVWRDYLAIAYNPVSDSDVSNNLWNETTERIENHMAHSNMRCEIQDSMKAEVGNNPGFIIHATVRKGEKSLKAILYCGFNEHNAYTIVFTGKESEMLRREKAIDELMKTFVFRSTLI